MAIDFQTLKWITILTTLLVLISMGLLILTLLLIFMVNSILSHAGGQFATFLGFIASLITLPTALKIKTYFAKAAEGVIRRYDELKYHNTILKVSIIFQSLAAIVCFVSMTNFGHAASSFEGFMKEYKNKKSLHVKKYVDNVQFNLQCCGQKSYMDWSSFSCGENTIPFSCCKVMVLDECRLSIGSGNKTINTNGCGKKLTYFILSTLFTELILYLFTIFLLLALYSIRSDPDGIEGKANQRLKQKWDKFVNSCPGKNRPAGKSGKSPPAKSAGPVNTGSKNAPPSKDAGPVCTGSGPPPKKGQTEVLPADHTLVVKKKKTFK